MIVDFDDFWPGNERTDLLLQLKAANPLFKATLFAAPGLANDSFWEAVPGWLELAVHGWTHPTPLECANWSKLRMQKCLAATPACFVDGFKAPGWQISDGCYEALLERGWWVADQPYNDERRPTGLRVHRLDDGDHWHGHIQDVCGNGLQETFPELLERVKAATEFQFISEVVALPVAA